MDGENKMHGEDSRLLPNTGNHVSSDYAVLFTIKKKKNPPPSKFSLSLITLISFLIQDGQTGIDITYQHVRMNP